MNVGCENMSEILKNYLNKAIEIVVILFIVIKLLLVVVVMSHLINFVNGLLIMQLVTGKCLSQMFN